MRGRRWTFLVALTAALIAPAAARAAVSESAVKAAFIPRFARYVTWPPAARPGGGAPMVICVIGEDPFGDALNRAIAGQQVDGHGFTIKRMASAAGASGCTIGYVAGSHTGQTLAALGRQPILTVTDSRNSAQRGIIHFAIVNGRVRFFIDTAQAQARGLTVSSRLLALAIGVSQK
jgi:hypothetical protein